MATDILVIDDEIDIRELVAGILEDEGHGTRTAGDSDSALAAVKERRPTLVFLDENGDNFLNWTITSSWSQSTLNRGRMATRGADFTSLLFPYQSRL